jgi:ribonuclease T2
MRLIAALLLLITGPAWADGEKAGDFDYYVMSLSWSPTFCALTGAREASEQCAAGKSFGFTLHGLWPQNDTGYPAHCTTPQRDPSRSQTAAMADIMGTSGLAWYEWKKHGRCSGLPAADYLAQSRAAFESIVIPDVFKKLNKDVELPVTVVEDAFIEANPGMIRNGITVLCDEEMIDEVRICLTKDLALRECGEDVRRDCRMLDALMQAVP